VVDKRCGRGISYVIVLGSIDGAAYYDFLGTRDAYLSMGT